MPVINEVHVRIQAAELYLFLNGNQFICIKLLITGFAPPSQRHGISRLPDMGGEKPVRRKFRAYALGCFHLDIAEVQIAEFGIYARALPSE
ncbi:MAG: hypothetical protein H7Y08_03705 [Rhizobiaceae bacterium]|nr:hypothetical protein [Rhizobiaceae bacterium]